MQNYNFGEWYFWDQFPMKVTFDGPNRLILINFGEILVKIKNDVYSNWKEWSLHPIQNNTRFLPAMQVIGGQPTVQGQRVGTTFFLLNNWKVRTWSGDHTIQLDGNIFADDGSPIAVLPVSPARIVFNLNTSNIIDTIEIPTTTVIEPTGSTGFLSDQQNTLLLQALKFGDWIALK